ncbi:MAG: hypothetical protein ACHQPI_05895 [Thermoanaerobaculia bacterium]
MKGVRTEYFLLPSAHFEAVPFEANEFDIPEDGVSIHDPAVSLTRFTAPSDGVYLLWGALVFEKQAGGYIRNVCLIKNGDVVTGVLACNALTSPNNCFSYEGCSVPIQGFTFLKASEYVEFWAYQDTGQPVEIRSGPVGAGSYGMMIYVSGMYSQAPRKVPVAAQP